MPRKYDRSNREAQARQTRQRILDAAVELHRQQNTGYEALAKAAGVSTATVRKHFPNKEALFQGCTSHFFASVRPPRFDDLATLADPRERLVAVVAELCRLHELAHGLIFTGAAVAAQSPTLAGAVDTYGALIDAAVEALADGAVTPAHRTVRALLDPFTYRAFRLSADFDAEAARRELTRLVSAALGLPPSHEPDRTHP